MTLALLDGDIIAYRAACGMAKTHDFGDTGSFTEVDLTKAASEAVKLAEEWAGMVDATDVVVAFTGSDKFRTRILPTYKANRKGEKPAAHAAAVAAIKAEFPHHLIPGLEADDVIGILMTTPKHAERAVMVSIDKDFKTIPGRLFNPMHPKRGIITTTPAMADYWWMFQTLVGDTTDNYKGCPGTGPVKAAALLTTNPPHAVLGTMWPWVVSAFRKAKLTEDDAIVQAQVARILRRENYDKLTKEIVLWHPTTPTRIPREASMNIPTGTPPCPVTTPLLVGSAS